MQITNDFKSVPGFLFVDHIAIAVNPGDLQAQVDVYKLMGFDEVHREEVFGTDQVREVLLRIGQGPNMIQLLEPLRPDSPVAKQLERAGGKAVIAHVALQVADARAAFDYMKSSGFNLIDIAPRQGSRGTIVFFVHPKAHDTAALGYLIEVVQEVAHGA